MPSSNELNIASMGYESVSWDNLSPDMPATEDHRPIIPWPSEVQDLFLAMMDSAWRSLTHRLDSIARPSLEWIESGCCVSVGKLRWTCRYGIVMLEHAPVSLLELWEWDAPGAARRARSRYLSVPHDVPVPRTTERRDPSIPRKRGRPLGSKDKTPRQPYRTKARLSR
jgi:hypothetical protein